MTTDSPQDKSRNLAIEVYFGPMEGLGLAAAVDQMNIGRGEQADLIFRLDPWVSRRHVKVGLDGNGLFVQDDGGQNGTWLETGQIHGKVALPENSLLVVGRTPIIVYTADTAFDHRDSLSMGQVPSSFKSALTFATNKAKEEKRQFVDSVDLLIGLLTHADSSLTALIKKTNPDTNKLISALTGRWSKDAKWVPEMLFKTQTQSSAAEPSPSMLTSGLIARARLMAEQSGLPEAEGVDLLAAIHQAPYSFASVTLSKHGLAEEVIQDWLRKQRRAKQTDPGLTAVKSEAVIDQTTTGPPLEQKALKTPAAGPSLFKLEGWDVFREAKEIHDRIKAVLTVYHLASPDQRKEAIGQVLEEATANMVPEFRKKVISHLQDLYPISLAANVQTADEDEIANLRAENKRLKAILTEKDNGQNRAATYSVGDLLKWTLDSNQAVEGLPADQAAALDSLRAIYRFARDVERLTASVVQSFQSRGADLTRYVIPPFRKDLDEMLRQIARTAESGDHQQVESYLAAIRQWLVASLVGYNRSAARFCQELIGKIDPKAIEKTADVSRWRDVMGNSESDLWKKYKEIFYGLQPDLIEDQVQEQAGILANEEFDKLKSNSK